MDIVNPPFHLLIIESSANEAEAYTSTLRNQGVLARGHYAEDAEDMETLLNQQPIDLVLCSTQLEHFKLSQAITLLNRLKKTIPVLAVTNELDHHQLLDALRQGAHDLVSLEHPELLKRILLREMAAVRHLQKRLKMEQAFFDTEKRCNQLMDSSRDAITYIHEGMHLRANTVYLELFGYSDIEALTGTPIMDMVAPAEQTKLKKYFADLSKHKKDLASKLEIKALKADGTLFDASLEFSPASIDGESCTQIIIRDQSLSKELVEKLQTLSNQDSLTGTYNRQYFMTELGTRLNQANRPSGGPKEDTVIYLDLDKFRALKDRFGLTRSDLILSAIANLLRPSLTANDTLSRFSDHAFAILLRERKLSEVMTLAETLRKTVENHVFEVGKETATATCSIGITVLDRDTKDPQTIMSRADVACEIVRKKGNAVHLHDPIADERAAKELEKQQVENIKNAIKNNRLRMVFQPVISLLGDASENWEVLVRMLDEDNNILLPEQFFGIAEKYKLLVVIDRWMIKNALAALSKQRATGKATNFYIKLASVSFTDESLLPWLAQQLNTLKIPGDSVIFEVDESTALNYLNASKKFLDGLKPLHCRFALTHFGISQTPMNALRHLPQVHIIKLDGSLIRNLGHSSETQAQVKSLNETLHEMNKKTIATQVEDANSLAILWQYGVDYIQGNFLQEPLETLTYDFSGESG